jgi:tight adherence protein C
MSEYMMPVFGAAAVGAALVLIVFALAQPRKVAVGPKRSFSLITGGLPGSEDLVEDLSVGDRIGRPLLGWLQTLGRRVTPVGTPERLRKRLDLAGNPSGWNVETLFVCKAVGTIVGVALAAALFVRNPSVLMFVAAVGFVAMGYWITDILLYNTATRRQDLMRKAAPDAIDMLTVCVEAGQGFDAAIAQVSRNTNGPLASEFARLLQEMQIGRSRLEAFEGLIARTNVPELTGFINAILQADKLGVPIAQVLREQSHEMRLRRRQHAEEQAMKVPVKIIFPVVVCIFPALMIIVIGPGAMGIKAMFNGM